MPLVARVIKRNGIHELLKLAKQLCAFIVAFRPVILAVTNNNTDVKNALNAALAACSVLEAELEAYVNYGD